MRRPALVACLVLRPVLSVQAVLDMWSVLRAWGVLGGLGVRLCLRGLVPWRVVGLSLIAALAGMILVRCRLNCWFGLQEGAFVPLGTGAAPMAVAAMPLFGFPASLGVTLGAVDPRDLL